jgi:hypothetical protein
MEYSGSEFFDDGGHAVPPGSFRKTVEVARWGALALQLSRFYEGNQGIFKFSEVWPKAFQKQGQP